MLNERGHEELDSTPVAKPAGFRTPPTMDQLIAAFVRGELSRRAEAAGGETFEDANDFDVDDEDDPTSTHELPDDIDHFRYDNDQVQEAALARAEQEVQTHKRRGTKRFHEEVPISRQRPAGGPPASHNRGKPSPDDGASDQ